MVNARSRVWVRLRFSVWTGAKARACFSVKRGLGLRLGLGLGLGLG